MKVTCCYKCEKRREGCHSECAEYLKVREALDRQNHARALENVVNGYEFDVVGRNTHTFTHDMRKGGKRNNA